MPHAFYFNFAHFSNVKYIIALTTCTSPQTSSSYISKNASVDFMIHVALPFSSFVVAFTIITF